MTWYHRLYLMITSYANKTIVILHPYFVQIHWLLTVVGTDEAPAAGSK